MIIVEEEGKLFRKEELSVEDIESLITLEEEKKTECDVKIEHYKTFLPVEELEEEDVEEIIEENENQNF